MCWLLEKLSPKARSSTFAVVDPDVSSKHWMNMSTTSRIFALANTTMWMALGWRSMQTLVQMKKSSSHMYFRSKRECRYPDCYVSWIDTGHYLSSCAGRGCSERKILWSHSAASTKPFRNSLEKWSTTRALKQTSDLRTTPHLAFERGEFNNLLPQPMNRVKLKSCWYEYG